MRRLRHQSIVTNTTPSRVACEVTVESSLGRLRVSANRSATIGVHANGSIATAGLRDEPYRKAMGSLNRLSGERVVTAEGEAFARAKHDEYRNGEDVEWLGSGKATPSVESFGRDLGIAA